MYKYILIKYGLKHKAGTIIGGITRVPWVAAHLRCGYTPLTIVGEGVFYLYLLISDVVVAAEHRILHGCALAKLHEPKSAGALVLLIFIYHAIDHAAEPTKVLPHRPTINLLGEPTNE